jgi:hypothetical protein
MEIRHLVRDYTGETSTDHNLPCRSHLFSGQEDRLDDSDEDFIILVRTIHKPSIGQDTLSM